MSDGLVEELRAEFVFGVEGFIGGRYLCDGGFPGGAIGVLRVEGDVEIVGKVCTVDDGQGFDGVVE